MEDDKITKEDNMAGQVSEYGFENEQIGDKNSENREKFQDQEDKNQIFRPEMMESGVGKDKISMTYVLLAIFIVLLAVSYSIKNKSFSKNDLGADKKFVFKAEDKDINKVEIIKGGNSTILENNNGIWQVPASNNFKADQEAIKSVIEEAFKLNKYILASDNKGKKGDFEVNEEKGVNVKLYKSGEAVANFFVGKAGPDFDSTYIRLDGEDAVYLSKGYVRYYFDKEDWRDLSIYDFPSEKVNKLALKYRDVASNVMMEKNGDKWEIKLPRVKEASIAKVDSILNILGKLKANDVEYKKDAKDCGFAQAPLVVRLESVDGSKYNLIIGGKMEDGKYYAKREEDNVIYIVNKETADGLMKKAEDF